MSIFDSWDDVKIPRKHNGSSLGNVIKFPSYQHGSSRAYRRFVISKYLTEQTDADRFSLKTKGGLFALVPDEDGQFYFTNSKVIGFTTEALDAIVEKIGCEECQASVVEGAVVFPFKDEFIIG